MGTSTLTELSGAVSRWERAVTWTWQQEKVGLCRIATPQVEVLAQKWRKLEVQEAFSELAWQVLEQLRWELVKQVHRRHPTATAVLARRLLLRPTRNRLPTLVLTTMAQHLTGNLNRATPAICRRTPLSSTLRMAAILTLVLPTWTAQKAA